MLTVTICLTFNVNLTGAQAVSVLQAQIALVKKDPATWDVAGWKDAIFNLKGVHPDQEAREEDPAKEDGATSKEV